MKNLTIGEAARQAGVGVETIRFYERRGLVEQPLKPQEHGFRVYSPEQIKRVKFIRRAQRIGFSLQEIRELLSLRADPEADCSEIRAQAAAKLEEVARKIEQLREIETALKALIAVCPGRGGLQACTILDTLAADTLAAADEGAAPRIEAEGPLPSAPPTRGRRRDDAVGGGRRKQRRAP